MKFRGTLEGLQAVMMQITSQSNWKGSRNHFQCRMPNGAILNWWASTGTITVQGPEDAAAQLESALENLVLKSVDEMRERNPTLRGDYIDVEYSEVVTTANHGAMLRHQRVETPRPSLQLLKRK